MRRRTVLALVGAGAGVLAGCGSPVADDSSSSPSGTPGTSPSETPTEPPSETPAGTPTETAASEPNRRVAMGTSVSVDGAEVTVEHPHVRQAIVGKMSLTEETFLRAHEGQYVLVDVTTGGDAPPAEDLRLRSLVDGRPVPDSEADVTLAGPPTLAVPFPTGRHESAAIRWSADGTTVDWSLPASVRERLAREPRFRVTNLATRHRDGELVLDMRVTNDGERDGLFTARVSLEGFNRGHVVQFPLAVGESRSYTDDSKILLYLEDDGGGTLTVQFPDANGLARRELRVERQTPTAG